MTTITREQQKQILIDTANHVISRDNTSPYSENLRELARIALASLTAEPVAWTDAEELRDLRTVGFCEMFTVEPVSKDADMYRVIPLYTDSPVPERERIRREHAEWSDATFGDVGPIGPLKHLSKEALEAAADPSDPLEWADMQFLLWDAQRRMGISDEFITRAMIEKLEINKSRQWPEPKEGEPRLHIKEQPATVVPEECPAELPYAQVKAAADLYALCWQSGEVVTYTPDPEKATIWLNNYSGTCVQEYVKLERLQEALAGNSPVIPDGYALVPVEPTDEMIVAAMDSDDVTYNESDDTVFYVHHREIYKAMLAAAQKTETGPCTK
ncbi:DUF550 domain-containing protein [Salmonella enterica]|nr:DUF550 domain-containing protein [Salmonella enterica]ECS6901390.1 DUF550 domain-containing protein [Salmonella enterica]EHI8599540.1 DUF550 domain-containing protein [Salmonella enterica subsp. enterica serovar 51:z:1,5]EHI8983740.1 DUF550 domain-containing protein [Salmonella enterica subsp. enterica serovar 51:z:1,5]EHO7591721.1 DUF550 domain-containing protein [Salmonella enterica]